MQTFSHMRRSRFDLQPLLNLALFGAALVYESLTTIVPWLTPLLGVGFVYWRRHYRQKNYYFPIFLFFLYSVWFEIDHNLLPFSFVLTALFYHYFLSERIESALNCIFCKYGIYLLYAYGGYYLFNLFAAFLFNMPLPPFNDLYIIYMISDLLVTGVLF